MKEIKFRVWNGLEMISLNNAIDRWLVWIQRSSSSNDWILESYFDDVIIMQYTWVKDKNGKDVFEGDVLSVAGWSIVSYRDRDCWFKFCYWEWDNEIHWDLFWDCKYCEIIWNIYENPELLTIVH